jgi:hypothetical protein
MDMNDVVVGLTTKSDKIRALGRAGYTRSQIAGYLGIRYQHVRNVLVDEERKAGVRTLSSNEMADPGRPFVHKDDVDVRRAVRIQVGSDGSMALPPALLAAAGILKAGALLARFDDGEIKLMTPEATTRNIQTEMRKYVPEGVSLVDELIQERRREAKREQGDA